MDFLDLSTINFCDPHFSIYKINLKTKDQNKIQIKCAKNYDCKILLPEKYFLVVLPSVNSGKTNVLNNSNQTTP